MSTRIPFALIAIVLAAPLLGAPTAYAAGGCNCGANRRAREAAYAQKLDQKWKAEMKQWRADFPRTMTSSSLSRSSSWKPASSASSVSSAPSVSRPSSSVSGDYRTTRQVPASSSVSPGYTETKYRQTSAGGKVEEAEEYDYGTHIVRSASYTLPPSAAFPNGYQGSANSISYDGGKTWQTR